MIQDCKDRVFSAYKTRSSSENHSSPDVSQCILEHPQSPSLDESNANISKGSTIDIIDTLYQPALPSEPLSRSKSGIQSSKPSAIDKQSDSGYGSELALPSTDGDGTTASQLFTTHSTEQQLPPQHGAQSYTQTPALRLSSTEEIEVPRTDTYATQAILPYEYNDSQPFHTIDDASWGIGWERISRLLLYSTLSYILWMLIKYITIKIKLRTVLKSSRSL